MSTQVAQVAGRWVHDLSWETVPPEVRDATVLGVLQSVAGGVAGIGMPEAQVALSIARAEAEGGPCTVWGTGLRVPVSTAIFVNSVVFCSLEQQEMHVASGTHPLEVVVPAALNVAERHGLSGTDLLEAVLAGTEVVIALGLASMAAMPTGGAEGLATAFVPAVYGAIGAAAATARLLRLDADQTAGALCQAANLASGLSECIKAGSTEYHYSLGDASRIGYLAARLAEAGAEFAPSTFEGPAGFFHRFGEFDATQLQEADFAGNIEARLGKTWGMPEHIYKRYPVHFANLAYIDAAKLLRSRHHIDAAQIEAIDVALNDWCELNKGGNLGPYTRQEDTRAATAYGIASMLVRGHYSLEDVEVPDAPELMALVAKTRIHHFDDVAAANDWMSVRVVVSMSDGASYTYDSVADGFPDYRLDEAEVRELAQTALGRVVGESPAQEIVDALAGIEGASTLAPLFALLSEPHALEGQIR